MHDLFSEEKKEMNSFFENENKSLYEPLASKLRPKTLDQFIGQDKILQKGKLLRRIIEEDKLRSLILYGPPGTGKTTLAHIISKATASHFEPLNAVLSNVNEIKKVLTKATDYRRLYPDRKFILFIDEIHRFNKAQQDVLMPSVESGLIVLIGATTQNPFFSINGPLISRSTVIELSSYKEEECLRILERAIQLIADEEGRSVDYSQSDLQLIAKLSNGDARRLLNILETVLMMSFQEKENSYKIDSGIIQEAAQKKAALYDKNNDAHYDTISAFIKSMRGSDPDAAVYWLAKILYAGEDLRFIARRMIIFASEDIGNADPQALTLAVSTLTGVEFVGMPEARILLGHCACYLSCAPKSNAAYLAINNALSDVENKRDDKIPEHLRSTGYSGAKQLGRGQGYQYPHDHEGHYVEQEYRENSERYYFPTEQGHEKKIKERMNKIYDSRKSPN